MVFIRFSKMCVIHRTKMHINLWEIPNVVPRAFHTDGRNGIWENVSVAPFGHAGGHAF
jgi:hypothetical protein